MNKPECVCTKARLFKTKNIGGPLVAKRTICGSHTWSGRPSMATKFPTDGPGDHLWQGTTSGVTAHVHIDSYITSFKALE